MEHLSQTYICDKTIKKSFFAESFYFLNPFIIKFIQYFFLSQKNLFHDNNHQNQPS